MKKLIVCLSLLAFCAVAVPVSSADQFTDSTVPSDTSMQSVTTTTNPAFTDTDVHQTVAGAVKIVKFIAKYDLAPTYALFRCVRIDDDNHEVPGTAVEKYSSVGEVTFKIMEDRRYRVTAWRMKQSVTPTLGKALSPVASEIVYWSKWAALPAYIRLILVPQNVDKRKTWL